MKLTNYFLTIATACDLSNDASYGFFKQNLAQIDSVIENYFEMENMTTRKIQNIIFFLEILGLSGIGLGYMTNRG